MSLDIATIDHTCNVIRRQIQEEFPDLTLHFIVRDAKQKTDIVENHPAGPLLRPLIKKIDSGMFGVIGRAKEKKLLPFMTREKILACVLLEPEGMDADVIRHQAYALTWHVLGALEDESWKKEKTISLRRENDEELRAWQNMLADAFSALVLEMNKKKGAIRALAKRRAGTALERAASFSPDQYPYPVIMDATQLIYDDTRRDNRLSKLKFSQAFEMTKEIGITFDKSTVLQWWAFARPAQEMAWLNIPKNKILGAAIHSAENPYARSTAYMIAEMLTLEPTHSGPALYNSFTDQEVNQRHHRRICDEVFDHLISTVATEPDPKHFRDTAKKQNEKLLDGNMIGWCAPGLLAAANAYEMAAENEKTEAARKAFHEFIESSSGEIVRKLAHAVMNLYRSGDVTKEHLTVLLKKDPDLESYAETLAI